MIRLCLFHKPVQLPKVHLATEMSLDLHSSDLWLLKGWALDQQCQHHWESVEMQTFRPHQFLLNQNLLTQSPLNSYAYKYLRRSLSSHYLTVSKPLFSKVYTVSPQEPGRIWLLTTVPSALAGTQAKQAFG